MNSKSTTGGFKTAIVITAAATLATGCSCFKGGGGQAKYRATPAPIVSNEYQPAPAPAPAPMGGTETEVQTSAGTAAGETVIPLHEEKLVTGTQQSTEQVRIKKRITTETVNQPVQVRHETVTIERVPAGSEQAGAKAQGDLGTAFKGGEMTIDLHQEKPFAETEVVPSGAIVVHKKVTTEPMTIQKQVRREEAYTEPSSSSSDVTISGNLKETEAAGGGPSNYGESTGAGAGGGITKWSQLTSASDPSTLAGRQVNLSNVKVQQQLGDHMLAVGPDKGQPFYVESDKPLTGITPGQKVDLKGFVQEVPADISSMHDQQAASALQGQKVFINGSVTPSSW